MYIIPHQYFIEFMHNITSLARFVALSYYVSRKGPNDQFHLKGLQRYLSVENHKLVLNQYKPSNQGNETVG